jgi:hypothetical protein
MAHMTINGMPTGENTPQWNVVDAATTKLEPEEAEAMELGYDEQLKKGFYLKQGNKVVGYCDVRVGETPKYGKYFWIYNMYIVPRARMAWVNSNVAEQFIEKLKELGRSESAGYFAWRAAADSVRRISEKIEAEDLSPHNKQHKNYLIPIGQLDVGLLTNRL